MNELDNIMDIHQELDLFQFNMVTKNESTPLNKFQEFNLDGGLDGGIMDMFNIYKMYNRVSIIDNSVTTPIITNKKIIRKATKTTVIKDNKTRRKAIKIARIPSTKNKKKRKRSQKIKSRKKRKLNLKKNSNFFNTKNSKIISDDLIQISMKLSKNILKNEKLLNIFWKIVKIGLPNYCYKGMISEIKDSDRVFILEGYASELIKNEDCEYCYESINKKKVICLCFACIRYCQGFNQLILMCSNLKAKKIFNVKGFGSILMNAIRNYIKRRIYKKKWSKSNSKIYAYIDPKSQEFYEKQKFKHIKSGASKRLIKCGLKISYNYENDKETGVCDLYKLVQ
jgi:hypothetical protein